MHDDFNKWFWYRTLWNPRLSAEEITAEYCRYWFGPQAEAEVAQAIFLMEETLEKPVIDNPGIAKAVDLLHSAGEAIPPNLMRIDYRWHVITEKALIDRYLQLQLAEGAKLKQEAVEVLANAESSTQPVQQVQAALEILDRPLETDAMKEIREKVERLGEESNKVIGYRVPALYVVDRYDLAEVGWWKQTLRAAISDPSDSARVRNAAQMVMHYEDPGEGGFYEDPGWPNESPHLEQGFTLWTFGPPFGPSRLSAYSCANTARGSDGGLVFVYDRLDPNSEYVVRFSTGRKPESGSEPRGRDATQLVEADGHDLSGEVPISQEGTNLYEFDIPRELTHDGQVRISFVGKSGSASVNDIWLLRKDKMSWTARN